MIKYKFLKSKDEEFASTLRSRVNSYFQENGLSRNANRKMVIKSISLLTWYLAPFLIIIFGGITNHLLLFTLWVIMGLGKAFVGTAVMHDSLHGSYSKKKSINKMMGYSAAIIGLDSLVWKIQHNVLHHTYTNIEDTDEDILPRIVFRFSEHQPLKWIHKFQHIYAPIFYCVPVLEWITTKDFIKAFEYREMRLIKPGKEFRLELAGIIARKLIYIGAFIALPIYMVDISGWTTFAMIIGSGAVTGIMVSMIFQTAHVTPDATFTKEESEQINQSWSAHQLFTTINFGRKQPIVTWLFGGLNFQIEHHLFPDICHVHYPAISKIVEATTQEFGLPYYCKDTFAQALSSHFKHLKNLGQKDYIGHPAY